MNWKIQLWALLVVTLTAIVLFLGAERLDETVRTGAGYKAKIACSEIFLAGREPEAVLHSEFDNIDPFLSHVRVEMDDANREVTASGPLGIGQSRAIYRDGYGCALENGSAMAVLPALGPVGAAPWAEAKANSPQRLGNIDYGALDQTINDAFRKNDLNHRALLVAVDGKIVAEHYAEGFSQETPFASWSMAKSVTATILGAAVMRGLVDIDDPAPVPEWRSDPKRSAITWNNLLHMQSGLDFGEDYGGAQSDVNRMLFQEYDAGGFAAKEPAIYAAGEHWAYSSGTSNIIARTLRGVLEKTGRSYHEFARKAVFEPIGAASFVMETDASGSSIGSSFVYATARDWARLGELYRRGGVWNGERLLPEGWSDYVAAPASASDNQYGAHFWLNRDGADKGDGEARRERFVPGVPEDIYYMAGHEGQYVFIIPSKKMVIVRTGITRGQPPAPAIAPLIKVIYETVAEPEHNIGPAPAQ